MPPARLPFPTVGVHRFRDCLVKDGSNYYTPVWRMAHPTSGLKVTVAPVALGAHPSYFAGIQDMMLEHDGAVQVGQTQGIVEPGTQEFPENATDERQCMVPKVWASPGTPLYGIDSANRWPFIDFSAVMGGHFFPNGRALTCYNNMRKAMETHGVVRMMAPLSVFHVPTVLKKLEDDGFVLEYETRMLVVSEHETNEKVRRVVQMASISRINNGSNDFFPSILVFTILLLMTSSGERKQHPANPADWQYPGNQPYPQGYQGYPPQGYPPPQYPQGYPPQYQQYPPQYPPQQYQASPPPSPGYSYQPQTAQSA